MARAYSIHDDSDLAAEPQPGQWHALRGELVALLDQVEGRYAQDQAPEPEPALTGLTQRVRNLRDQVVGPEPTMRRQEALRTVKRAVDRFSDRDEASVHGQQDALKHAIAEIRGRQLASTAPAPARRVSDSSDFRDLSALVGGLSGRLERLEGELKTQRSGKDGVREVANQVEQLTHVVELLAGAVGETGQVKRLESQIGALAALIEEGPRVDLSTINKRLDDVSATVGKLAELQAQQMEREILRDDVRTEIEPAGALAPAMQAIEKSVRNVYDRIDSIEKNVALSSSDFEHLTTEMAAFTQAMKDGKTPNKLVNKVDALATAIGDLSTANTDVAGLKADISALRDAVLAGMEPRFASIETRIDELSGRIATSPDQSEVENQLKLLMQRMDDASAQLDGLAKLYSTPSDMADLEAMATLVAERTSDAMTRKAPAPVAMFGPDSLKSIEDRIHVLIKTAGKGPDYETIATMVAEKTSAAVAKSAPQSAVSEGNISALEQRVTAILNTTGKETADRLTRLEAALAARAEITKAPPASAKPKPAAEAVAAKPDQSAEASTGKLDAMLLALSSNQAEADRDAMPANPADDAPLIDPGFKDTGSVWAALDAKMGTQARSEAAPSRASQPRPTFNPSEIERPAPPKSSFASDTDPFAPLPGQTTVPQVEAPPSQNNTSTFVAAARRAQRARQETVAAPAEPSSSASAMGRAFARFRPARPADDAAPAVEAPAPKAEKPAKLPKAEKPAKPLREKRIEPKAAEPVAPRFGEETDEALAQPGFLIRHRRPLLLAAALVTVSVLALNLILQRTAEMALEPAPAEAISTQPAAEPSANQDVSLVRPEPRIIDMVDDTATGSINPATASTFSKPMAITPMPATLVASIPAASTQMEPLVAPAPAAPETTGSIEPAAPAAMVTFELPPEAIGPIELRQAAADGDARAQFEVAAIYTEGRAIEQDYAEAAKWYERSAAQGLVPAQYRLGNLYETGTGVEKDLENAKLWYQRAAEAGNRMAMHNLAALYAGGQLGEQEFESAAEWFQQAAARGMTDSQFNLGMLYARGLGLDQDFEQSFKWFSLAAKNGDADATKARDDIAKNLNADAVSRLGSEIAAWEAQSIDLAANFAPLGTWSSSFDPGEPITSREVVSKVQQALGKLGFDVGTPDGLSGPKTAEAIKTFERGTGMSEVGDINPRLLAVLGSQPV
ncbi:peptidoglycan-binding protein [Devosia naphthalenivorans]|uniref:peptidoglycan-binding protein n=1 Tax=Devosia naphthalenivorans TaxID=2082392 RepID=UPI000D3942AF|nr:peptidoglycan-binding protein [Devosia naphthalenivorans]